jgi:hypothetical protein
MTQEEAKKELRSMISRISEQMYSAVWKSDIEYIVWEMICDHSKSYICPIDMDLFHQLSTVAQGWWTWKIGPRKEGQVFETKESIGECTFVSMDEWLNLFNKKCHLSIKGDAPVL